MEAVDGSCLMEGLTNEEHLNCADCTWSIEIVDPNICKVIDDKCFQLKSFKKTGQQAFFIKVAMKLFPQKDERDLIDLQDLPSASTIPTEIDSASAGSVPAPPPSEKLTEELDFLMDGDAAAEIESESGLQAFLA